MLVTCVVLAALAMLPGSPPAGTAAPGATAIEPEVLALREAAWRAYFAGDETALGAMLPDDFIGINMFDGPFVSREQALEQARSIRESGGRLLGLEFPETRAQRYGDVIVFYGRFAAVVETGGPGSRVRELKGRLTEVFLSRQGRWIHTGWHLDTVSTP
jgi:hypothetical protein